MNPSSLLQAQSLADMVAFARVVDAGSFSAAARSMGLTKSAVSKQVRRLEAEFAVQLLHRTTRRLSLTEAGQALYEHAEQAARLGTAVQDTLSRLGRQPAGVLRMTASLTYGRHVLAPLLPAFHERYPEVQVALTLLDRHVDLVEEGYDLAIRLTEQPPGALVGRPLHRCDFVTCATPAFLRRKRPQHPRELGDLPCLAFFAGPPGQPMRWRFLRPGEPAVEVPVRGPVAVNSSDVVRELVLAGLGVGLLPRFVVAPDLQARRLRSVLPDWTPQAAFGPTAWALWAPHRQMPPKLRVMIDYLVESLAERE